MRGDAASHPTTSGTLTYSTRSPHPQLATSDCDANRLFLKHTVGWAERILDQSPIDGLAEFLLEGESVLLEFEKLSDKRLGASV
jgi:hypothetical protein